MINQARQGIAATPGGDATGSMLPAWFLALGTFAIGTEGFMIAPLLPTIATDLGMSLPATAMLVVVFTLVLALSSPVSTVLTGGLRRRDTLLVAMALFIAGNLLAALSAGPPSQAPVALSLNTSTMYLGFSIGSAMGAGIINDGNIWLIGATAALAECIALVLDRRLTGRP